MKKSLSALLFTVVVAWASVARPVAQQIGAGDTALLFGGTDAEGGIGDWYLSNGTIEAIIDNVGVAQDLVGIVPPGTEPPIQSEIAFTGGTIIDLGRVGENDDQLTQMFTVGGLSTSNFLVYDSISAPGPFTIRATGKVLFPPTSVEPSPCLDVVTDYTADSAGGAFITITSTATNNCGVPLPGFGGFLDVFIWTIRSIVPFSGGGLAPVGGRGFNHPVLNLSNPISAVEIPAYMGGPGLVDPSDGVMDPATNTTCGEVSYGLVGVSTQLDPDAGGPTPPSAPSTINSLFGVSSSLVTALGNFPTPGGVAAGGSFTYVRRVYAGNRNDVQAVSDPILTELSTRGLFSTGTISGDVDAADSPFVHLTRILVTRLGRCQGNPSISCKVNADCGGNGPCNDPVPTAAANPGAAMTQIRPDAAGVFGGVVLPQGDYELVVSSSERSDVTVSPVVVGAGNTPVTIPTLSARGSVQFTVREKTAGLPLIPAKLVFKGVTPTPDPRFHKYFTAILGSDDILPETFAGSQLGSSGDASGQGNVVYTGTGSGTIQVRPGTYDIYATRGMEYSVALRQVTVPASGSASVDFRLKRVIKTKNAISADFHVHSGRSLDTSATVVDRVKSFAGEGVEVMVSTDHDKNIDYTPIITSLGLGSRLRSIIGNEVTGSVPNPPNFPNSIGHINAWPLTVSPNSPRDGAIDDEYVAPNWLFKRLRDAGASVIQYNHPRAGVSGLTTIGIFNNIGCNRCANDIDMTCMVDTDCPVSPAPRDCTCVGYQPDRPIGMAPNDILLDDGINGPGTTANPDGITNLDFDVMEIANATKDSDFPSLRQMRRDWLSLLNQGIVKPGTGVSDSHRTTVEHAGWARTYVNGVGDDPAALDLNAFDTQVKAGNMLISGGPYIEFSVKTTGGGTAGLGGMVAAPNGSARLKIRVRSPAWMPIEEVRVIANGFVVASFDDTTRPRVRPVPNDFQKTGRTSRFRTNLTLPVGVDTYFIVEAGPKIPVSINTLPTPPPIVDIVEPDVVPMSITNPIFVDRNGNSMFDPPGLPVMTAALPLSERPIVAGVEPDGFWARVRHGLERLASRVTGEVVAGRMPGEMTGITKEQKTKAIEKGEHFPIYQFSIPSETVEAARRSLEEAEKQAVPGNVEGSPAK